MAGKLLNDLATAVFDTITSACTYAFVAVGFTIMFGASKVMNVAYGDILALGA